MLFAKLGWQETAKSVLGILRLMLSVWLIFFVLTRIHMLHSAISRLSKERHNEHWLLEQCQQDEFYHNMKHHSTLCDEVSTNADDVLLLHAIREVVENSYVCGFQSCAEIVDVALASTAKQSMYVLVSGVCLLILAPSILFPLWRRSLHRVVSGTAHRRALREHSLYNDMYDPYSEDAMFMSVVPTGRGGMLRQRCLQQGQCTSNLEGRPNMHDRNGMLRCVA